MKFNDRIRCSRTPQKVEDLRPKVNSIMQRLGTIVDSTDNLAKKFDQLESTVRFWEDDQKRYEAFVEKYGNLTLKYSSMEQLNNYLEENKGKAYFEIPYDSTKMVMVNYTPEDVYPVQWIMGGKLYGKNTEGIVAKRLNTILSEE